MWVFIAVLRCVVVVVWVWVVVAVRVWIVVAECVQVVFAVLGCVVCIWQSDRPIANPASFRMFAMDAQL